MHTEVMLKATDMPNEIVPISAGRKVAPAGRVGERLSRRNSLSFGDGATIWCTASPSGSVLSLERPETFWRGAWAQYSPPVCQVYRVSLGERAQGGLSG